jgi:hypothetical protein
VFEDLDMPAIAIAGGFVLLFVLACVVMLGARRRRTDRSAPRRTSFHLAVIDPAIAEHGRAAWECSPAWEPVQDIEVEDHMVEVEDVILPPPSVSDHTSIGYAPMPRYARGSTPAISTAPRAHVSLPARPLGWGVPVAPSVTARMRASRRG